MTNLPNPDNGPGPQVNRRLLHRRLRRIGIPVGLALLAGAVGGTWWGWIFVHEQLAPLVEKNLSESLKRPVKLGRVERFSLTSLRFGPSSVPATATDPDRLTVDAIDIGFNPLALLLTRNLNLDITAIKPTIYLEQAADGTWISTQIQEQENQGPVKTDLQTIRFRDAEATLVPASKTGSGHAAPVVLNQLNGKANFLDQNQRITYELAGKSTTGGTLNLMGETQRKPLQTNLTVQGQNFAIAELDRLIKLPISLPTGRTSGNVSVQIRPNQKIPFLTGTATFEGASLVIPRVPQHFTQAKGGLQLQGTVLTLDNVTARFGQIPVQASGSADLQGDFKLAARVKPVSLAKVIDTFQLKLPVSAVGEVVADVNVTGPLQQPIVTGKARNTKPGKVDRVDLSRYSAAFQLNTATQKLAIADVQATPTAGGQVTGSGTVKLSNPAQLAFNLNAVGVPADPIAQVYNNGNAAPIAIGRVNAQATISGTAANPRTVVRWQAPAAEYAGSGEILIANGVTTLRNTTLNVAGGLVSAQAQAIGGRWQALVTGSQIQLNHFAKELRGQFSGTVALAGVVSSFKPESIRAQGQARFSQGISVIGEPLTAQFQWDGQKVVVQRATAPGFSATGTVFARLDRKPEITGLDLDVRTTNYSLQAIALPIPGNVDYSGRVDFAGRVTGTTTDPRVVGGLTLRQFVLNGMAFDPVLRGTLQVARGVNLNLAGSTDRIALTLDSTYQPVAFDIRRGTAVATGRTRGDLLIVDARNFPLSFLNTPATAALLPISGDLNGTIALNRSRLRQGDLSQLNANGDLTIANPAVGSFRASQFGGRISVTNGVATLSNAELRRGQSLFQINASAKLLSSDPAFKAQVKVAKGQLQDVLELLQLFDISDLTRGMQLPTYGTAADLETTPVEQADATLTNQLRRLSEIKTLLAARRDQRQANPLPELRELRGTFSGEVSATGSLRTGISANFNIEGQDWNWGDTYSAKQVVAIGSFEKGILTLLPLRFQSDQSLITFSGQIGGSQQSGQLRVENLPIERLAALVPLPLSIEGNLNATATISGSQDNPQAIGFLSLTNGSLNGTDVKEARGGFRYADARLDFGSRVLINGPEPLTLSGSIPQKLPFAAVDPKDDKISLQVNVKNEGLALLNLLNNQVSWVDGKGQVNLQVQGTLNQPIATGTASVDNATIQVRALPEPLKGVTGTVDFARDRLRVNGVKGQFSQGQVNASGVLPIFANLSPNDPDQQTPLQVTLTKLALSLKGLYQGGINGRVQVNGTALSPVLSGNIRLTDGQVLLAAAAEQAGNGAAPSPTTDNPNGMNPAQFNHLGIQLGDRVQVVYAPLINFVAMGDLVINGSLDDLRPKGIIRLRSGQVNLYTTQFTLARGYPQTAEFVENQGLDPNLNIRLIASVPEVTRSRLPTSAFSSEVSDSPIAATAYGSLQTVRVQAQVRGPASQIFDNLELTSSPARTETEIVALLGAGFVNTLGRGDTALGIANLAGSALLTNIQGTIGNALGLSEFRLFPTITPQDNNRAARGSSSVLGLGAEAAIDITPTISFSVLRILTSNQPTQFGLRYRLNNQIILRGSSDFSGETLGIVEYETRF